MSGTADGPTAWLNRAGHGAEHVEVYVRRGVITLGWARIPGLEDLRELDAEQMAGLIARAGRGQPRSDVRELLDFRDGMQTGDVVVTPDPPRKAVLFGEITGDYGFEPVSVAGDHRHVRPVTWFGRWARYDLPPPLRKTLDDYQRTVLQLPNQEDWLALADNIRAGDGMPVAPRTPAGRRTGGERRPRRPAAKPTRVPSAPRQTCPVCGLDQAPTMFEAGSDRCRDCA